jgi:biotin-dependent carboxylase-like uncharacterized protein
MDAYAAAWANALLNNSPDAPVLELVLQGAQLKFLRDSWIALAGADPGCGIAAWTAEPVRAGRVLTFRGGRAGIWTYLAVPGGFAAERWMGSASVDARNGLGEVLRPGDRLSAVAVGPAFGTDRVARRLVPGKACRDYAHPPVLELLKGPQFERFDRAAAQLLAGATWTVSPRSDRTGFRLDGPALPVPPSIPSEPVLPGSFQIPGNGQPIVTMRDGPTVGGYAKIAIVTESGLDWLCQCQPGQQLRLQWAD